MSNDLEKMFELDPPKYEEAHPLSIALIKKTKYKSAIDAISELFKDTRFKKETTKLLLEDLVEEIEMMISSLE